MGCKGGAKNSAPRTWLVDAARRGAVILAGCEGRRVAAERRRSGGRLQAKGLEARVSAASGRCWIGGEMKESAVELEVHVEARVVVAACGALHSPGLLRRSGLRNPHIGRHLRLHPVMFIWGHFPDAAPHVKSYQGAIMSAYCADAANWRTTGYGALIMVPTLHPAAFAAAMPWISARHSKDAMLRFSKTAFLITITRDSGDGGRVWEDSSGDLHVSYDIADADRENCVEAACLGLRILAAAGAAAIGTTNLDGAALQLPEDDEEKETAEEENSNPNPNPNPNRRQKAVDQFVSRLRHSWITEKSPTVMGSAHQMGTCRMGTRPSASVVDPDGQTWEASGLFVADASVFPTATGVNPMITVQSIALCISHSILRFLSSP